MAEFTIVQGQTKFTIIDEDTTLVLRTAERTVANQAAGPAGGDLEGTYPDPSVKSLQGVDVPTNTPTAGQVIKATGAATSEWADDTGATLAGDVTGPAASTVVEAVRGILVSATPPTAGQVLKAVDPSNAQWALDASAGGSGWIYVADVRAVGGAETNRVYQDAGNTVLQSITVSGYNLEVDVRASYPLVDVGGTSAQLSRDAGGGFYAGTVAITIPGDGPILCKVSTPDDEDGASDTVTVAVSEPPVIASAIFTGGYPGSSQTEVKEDDSFSLQVTTDNPFDLVEIADLNAGKFAQIPVTTGTVATVSLTVADRGTTPQLLGARVRVRDASTGAFSANYDTQSAGAVDGVNVINLNNLFPTLTFGAASYPLTQQALKGAESATIPVTSANLDSIAYDSPNGDLSITNPTTDETPKTVSRIAGSYNVVTNNFRGVATRNANAAVTTTQAVVNIANVAPVIDVVTPAARLRSGGNDGTVAQDHTITIQSNQELLSAPTLDPGTGSAGVFQGAGFVGGPSDWTRDLRVTDDDDKGAKTWQNLSAVGLAGLVQTTIATGGMYTLGGFVARSLTFAAFATQTPMDVSVVDFSKLQAGIFTATNQPALKQPIATPPPVTNGYTIDNTGVKPTSVIWLDTAAAGSNSSGTAQITNVEEVV